MPLLDSNEFSSPLESPPRAPTDCTILLIDDEEANLDLLEDFLSAEGWRSIVRTDDSRKAATLFDAYRPDIVLLDLHMPFMSGYDVLGQIQDRVPGDDFVPVVILTADMLPATRTRALADGAHDFLTKPLDVDEVRLRVRNLLRTRLSHVEQRMARRAAEAATRARETILSVVAHDLRNPLASIAMDAEMARHLLSDEDHPDPCRSLLQIERTAARMHNLIEDLLEVARLEHGAFAIRTEPSEANAVFADAEEMLQPLARSREIRLAFNGPDRTVEVDMDRKRIVQVLSNLVGNALEFTPEGGSIQVDWAARERDLTVSVTDDGPGIAEDQIPHVFASFWRGSRERGSGLGLGLTITRAIIEAHGGGIWVESAPGDGTAVHFTLPLSGAAPGEPLYATLVDSVVAPVGESS